MALLSTINTVTQTINLINLPTTTYSGCIEQIVYMWYNCNILSQSSTATIASKIMPIAVTITKTDDGQFTISVDQDATPDTDASQAAPAQTDPNAPVDPNAAPTGDTDAIQDAQPATPVKDLTQAIQLLTKIMSQPAPGGQSPFDQGLNSTLSQRQ